MGHEPRNRAERRTALRKARRTAGAAMAAGSAALGTSAALIVGTAGPAAAANFTVTITTDEDDGNGTDCDPGDLDCSLREAIRRANDNAGLDTIGFAAGVTPTITLGAMGQLKITDDLTINGPGAGVLAVSGDNAYRVFYVYSAANNLDVTISGLTITDGDANVGDGGGIINWGENLTLTNSVVAGNEAADGGGIEARYFFTNPTVTINGTSTISNNTANFYGAPYYTGGDGGGIHFDGYSGAGGGSLSISGTTTITGNYADSDGGGINFDEGTLTITGTTSITDNDANGDGGGIYLDDTTGPVTITGATITGNYGGSDGGGIYLDDADHDVSITNTTISGNDADDDGGGIYQDDTDNNARLLITNSTISGNSADDGGGIYLEEPDGDVVITNSTISGNDAYYDGGGIYLYDITDSADAELQIFNTTISGNTAGDQGGGIEIDYNDDEYYSSEPNPVLIFNSTISGNTGAVGGGIDVEYSAELEIVQSTVTNNQSSGDTGGIYLAQLGPLSTAGPGERDKNAAADAADAAAEEKRDARRTQSAPANAPAGLQARQDAVEAPEPSRGSQVATPDQITLIGTIVSANAGFDIGGGAVDGDDAIVSDHSLIGTIAAHAVITDIGGTIRTSNPGLAALANNGGPTQTHALLGASVAIDAGPPTLSSFLGNAFDQRGPGFARVINGRVDIGAYEAALLFPDFTG